MNAFAPGSEAEERRYKEVAGEFIDVCARLDLTHRVALGALMHAYVGIAESFPQSTAHASRVAARAGAHLARIATQPTTQPT